MTRFLVNIPESFKNELKKQAEQKGETLNGLIRNILWDWLKTNENERR